jgi:hypothetical protein
MKPYRIRRGRRRWVVLDIEAVNWFDETCIVALTDKGDWIASPTVPDLIDTMERAGWIDGDTVFFAHYAGRYDALLLPRHLVATGWVLIRGLHASGAGFWCSDWQRGKTTLRIRDSARLLPGSVRAIGESVGLPKLEVDRSHMERLSWDETVTYCLRDCEIVARALHKLWDVLPIDGDTLAARATRTLRAQIPKDAWGWDVDRDRWDAKAYFGGRVEVFARALAASRSHDINSSYPARMCQALPTRFRGESARWDGEHGIIRARVRVPETCQYPVLPYRPKRDAWKGVTMFPTGEWIGSWCAPELMYAVECGAAEILEIEKVHRYEAEPWLRDFMVERFETRREAKRQAREATTPEDKAHWEFESYAQKILLNAVSGKLIEREDHESWSQTRSEGATVRIVQTPAGAVEFYATETSEPGAFRSAACAAYVLGAARVELHRGIVATGAAYCDTDAVYHPDDGRTPENVGDDLGQWLSEGTYTRAEFLAPKVYATWKRAYNQTPGEAADVGSITVRAKGFGLPDGWDDCPRRSAHAELWRAIKAGDPIVRERTRSFIGMLRSGDLNPARELISRTYHGEKHTPPKRCFDEQGNSRPWTMKELQPR